MHATNCLTAQIMVGTGSVKPGETARWHEYWKAGITNSIGPALGMVALKNITYSAQVLVGLALMECRLQITSPYEQLSPIYLHLCPLNNLMR